jgi:hypothetical protein
VEERPGSRAGKRGQDDAIQRDPPTAICRSWIHHARAVPYRFLTAGLEMRIRGRGWAGLAVAAPGAGMALALALAGLESACFRPTDVCRAPQLSATQGRGQARLALGGLWLRWARGKLNCAGFAVRVALGKASNYF